MVELHERYLSWLKDQVTPEWHKPYDELFAIMHAKEFVWLIPNDDNRIVDGLDLRYEFFGRQDALELPCSFLEMLVGLSRRVAFAAGGEPGVWAWTLVKNLGLHKMSGHIGVRRLDVIDEILEMVIWRNYAPDGLGGLFPLAYPQQDQRKVELWYQMSSYVDELFEL